MKVTGWLSVEDRYLFDRALGRFRDDVLANICLKIHVLAGDLQNIIPSSVKIYAESVKCASKNGTIETIHCVSSYSRVLRMYQPNSI